MKKVLIPTDLSVKSLKLAEYAFKLYANEMIDIVLMYPYRLPVWERELYNFNPGRIISENTNEGFREAKDELVRRHYVNVNSILIKMYTGVTAIAFKNFSDANDVKAAVIPQAGFLDFTKDSLFDPILLIQRKIPEINVLQNTKNDEDFSGHDQSSSLLDSLKKAFQMF